MRAPFPIPITVSYWALHRFHRAAVRDVIEDGVTGALDEDLAKAARRAPTLDPKVCREHALRFGWNVSAREFEGNLVSCQSNQSPQRDLSALDAVHGNSAGTSSGFSRS